MKSVMRSNFCASTLHGIAFRAVPIVDAYYNGMIRSDCFGN